MDKETKRITKGLRDNLARAIRVLRNRGHTNAAIKNQTENHKRKGMMMKAGLTMRKLVNAKGDIRGLYRSDMPESMVKESALNLANEFGESIFELVGSEFRTMVKVCQCRQCKETIVNPANYCPNCGFNLKTFPAKGLFSIEDDRDQT